MAGIKISDLPAVPAAELTDVFPIDQGVVTYKESNTQLLSLFEANIVITDANFSGVLSPSHGGTGENNGISTITLGGTLTTSGAFNSIFIMTATTNVTFPTSGTLATTSQIPSGAALTEVNDTNITLTLGGSPTTALVNAASITAGWSGLLSSTRGGTGINNGTNTITVGGNFAMSGAFTFTGTITANTAVTFPVSGTLATTSQLPVAAALTEVNDTNVTLTLGGSPSTALLQATSITAGWTGTLSPTRGGTGVNNGSSTLTLGGSLTTSGAFASTFTMTNTTSVTFPTSGTLATTSQIPAGAALTAGNDTNVTLTLGGSPTTALVNAASVTAGWTGLLSPARGGTGVNNGTSTFTIGGNTSFSGAFTFAGTLTNNTTVTFPTSGTLATTSQLPTPAALTETNDTNVTLTLGGTPSTALLQATSITAGWTGTLAGARGGTGVANTGLTINLGSATTGYVLTSDSSGNGTWQPATGGGGLTWTTVSGSTQTLAPLNGYVANRSSAITFSVPASAAVGDMYIIEGLNTGLSIIQMNTGQTCHFGANASSSAGSLTATNQYDAITITCTVANTTFNARGQGNWALA